MVKVGTQFDMVGIMRRPCPGAINFGDGERVDRVLAVDAGAGVAIPVPDPAKIGASLSRQNFGEDFVWEEVVISVEEARTSTILAVKPCFLI